MLVDCCQLCTMPTDQELILIALQKERDELHERILQVDRIISRIRSIDYQQPVESIPNTPDIPTIENDKGISFPKSADIKIQVLRVFEIVNKAAGLAELQQEYTNITGSPYKIREAVRSLHAAGIVKMLKYKNASRGFMWVKTDWIQDGQLLDKHKPLGFDLLYKKENLMFL